jgi:cytochrome c556
MIQRLKTPTEDPIMRGSKILVAMAILGCAFAPAVVKTDVASTLKEIMQGLRNDLIQIADGLLTGDLEQVAAGAQRIAKHPRISAAQVKLVAAELGTDMPLFKQLDTRVHNQALLIQEAAANEDGGSALQNFQEMTRNCIACHDAYKERVAEVLNRPAGP